MYLIRGNGDPIRRTTHLAGEAIRLPRDCVEPCVHVADDVETPTRRAWFWCARTGVVFGKRILGAVVPGDISPRSPQMFMISPDFPGGQSENPILRPNNLFVDPSPS